MGGNEIINSARTAGYMTGGDCPVNWIVCPPCDGITDAQDDDAYIFDNIAQAPWYDVQDEPTHRFLGVHGLSIDGITDSTRTGTIAEGITDGGAVGQIRHAVRQVRARVLLSAYGEDALEAGLSWLDAALEPDACGQHGASCGAVDACFYVACPPTREEATVPVVVWSDPITNRVPNPSFEGATMPPGTTKSTAWASSGGASMSVPGPSPLQIDTLTNETFLITPQNDGQFVRFGGTDHPGVAGVPIRVNGTGPVLLSPGLWDQMLIVAGAYPGPYFDGDGVDSTDPPIDYKWTGAANASSSTVTTGTVSQIPNEGAFQDAVDALYRSLHNVTCISGPLVQQKLHRGEMWGYVVEFTLAAATPWVYGITRPVTVSPTLPIIIQDVPFNLVPYPSAELASGTAVAATNYSNNPSVEVDATNWARNTATILSADVTGARSTALASAGTASFRSHFVASNSGGTGSFTAENTSATFPSTIAGQRMSVGMWASAQVVSGTAVIQKTEVFAIWRNGTTVLRTDLVGTVPAVGGGAVASKSIAVPVGATNVIVQAKTTLTSWSTGAIVDLYADAVTVSVP
jgi:hypothetical protein